MTQACIFTETSNHHLMVPVYCIVRRQALYRIGGLYSMSSVLIVLIKVLSEIGVVLVMRVSEA